MSQRSNQDRGKITQAMHRYAPTNTTGAIVGRLSKKVSRRIFLDNSDSEESQERAKRARLSVREGGDKSQDTDAVGPTLVAQSPSPGLHNFPIGFNEEGLNVESCSICDQNTIEDTDEPGEAIRKQKAQLEHDLDVILGRQGFTQSIVIPGPRATFFSPLRTSKISGFDKDGIAYVLHSSGRRTEIIHPNDPRFNPAPTGTTTQEILGPRAIKIDKLLHIIDDQGQKYARYIIQDTHIYHSVLLAEIQHKKAFGLHNPPYDSHPVREISVTWEADSAPYWTTFQLFYGGKRSLVLPSDDPMTVVDCYRFAMAINSDGLAKAVTSYIAKWCTQLHEEAKLGGGSVVEWLDHFYQIGTTGEGKSQEGLKRALENLSRADLLKDYPVNIHWHPELQAAFHHANVDATEWKKRDHQKFLELQRFLGFM